MLLVDRKLEDLDVCERGHSRDTCADRFELTMNRALHHASSVMGTMRTPAATSASRTAQAISVAFGESPWMHNVWAWTSIDWPFRANTRSRSAISSACAAAERGSSNTAPACDLLRSVPSAS